MDTDDMHSWYPFLKSPSNFSRPKSIIRFKRQVLANKPVH